MRKLLIYLIVIVFFLGVFPGYKEAETIATEPQVQVKLRNFLGNQSSISLKIVGSYFLNGDSTNLLTSDGSYTVKVESETLGLYDGTTKLAAGSELSIAPVKSSDHAVINNREYAGSFLFTVEKNQYVRPINTINMEDYVKSVVPVEMPALWLMEALKAQAVAARTYAYFRLNQVINDTTTFQVYGGVTSLHPRSSEAVDVTEGEILTYDGDVINAAFSASNGGKTEKLFNVWYPKSLSYFKVETDEYDTANTWKATLHKQQIDITSLDLKNPGNWWDSSNEIDATYASNIKKWMMNNLSGFSGKQIKIVSIPKVSFYSPTESGRFTKSNLTLEFFIKDMFNSDGKLELQTASINNQLADDMRTIIGTNDPDPKKAGTRDMKSNLFSINETNDAFVFSGSGNGHGVGLSQYGANRRAAAGILYKDILSFYYPGTALTKQYATPPEPVKVSEVTDKDTIVTGEAEAGSTVEVKANGSLIGSGTAGTDGKFVVTIPIQKASTELVFTATDKAGNVSEVTTVVVIINRDEVKRFEGRITAGYYHSAFLNGDGMVQAIGDNGWEQTKNVSNWRDITSISAGFSQTVGLKKDGTVVATGNNPAEESNVSDWTNIIQVSAGEGTTVGLKSDGTVVATGNNYSGQANVSDWTDIVAISAGGGHTVGLKSDGTVVAVGDNHNGETNVSSWKDIVEVSAGYNQTIGLKSDGTVVATGDNTYSETNVSDWKDIVSISAGAFHTVGLKNDGTVVSTGGLFPDTIDVSGWTDIVAISAGGSNILGLKRDGTIVSTGNNSYGQNNFKSMEDMTAVSASGTHTVGLTAEGTVISVGSNFKEETNVSDWRDIVSVTAWDGSTVGVKKDGTIAVAGDNFVGTTKEDIMGWTNISSVAMSTGGSHTVGVKKEGTVVGVGNNYAGQINVGEWKDIQSIAAGSDFTLGLKKDGTVIGTGNKTINVSDWKDIVAIAADFGTAVGLKKDGTVVSTDKNFFAESIGEWKDIAAISTKYGHTVGLKSNGTVVATGDNRLGQNNVSEWRDIVAVFAGNASTIGIKKDGTLVVAGLNPNLVPLNYYPSAPVESFDVSKKITKTGDSLNITVHFSKAMKNGMQLTLRGAVTNQSIAMEEVPGSNGKSYQSVFTVPSGTSGGVHFKLSNLVDANNQPFNNYYANNLVETDNESPLITGTDDTTLFMNSVFDPRLDVTATDHFTGDLTQAINISGTVNTTKKGVYTLRYSVMDAAGNITTVSRNITIVDNIKPVISGAASKTIYVNTTFDPRAGVIAMDNTDGNLTNAIKINGQVNSKAAGVYTLTYTVTDSSGNQTTVTRQIRVTLASPANLKAVAGSYNSVNLSWSAVSGASGYEIYRSTSSTGTYTKIAFSSSTSYSNTSLNTGTTYYYKVRAYQTVTPTAYSGFSSVVSAKPVLAIPTSVKAASSAYNSIKTSWTAVSGTSGYEVYRATSSTGSYYYAGSTTSTSFNNSGRATNTTYYYKIRAYRMVGTTKVYSNFSTVVYAKPIPSVPANFKAAKVSSTSFKLTWSAVAGASGYKLYRATSSTGAYTLLKSTTSLYYTNSGLIRGRTYYYKVRAYRMVGKTKVYSGWSTIISLKP